MGGRNRSQLILFGHFKIDIFFSVEWDSGRRPVRYVTSCHRFADNVDLAVAGMDVADAGLK